MPLSHLGPFPALRLSALQAAAFAWIGVSMPFMPVWLEAQGLDGRQIGFALSLGMITRMVFSQPVAALGDGRFGPKTVLIAVYALSALAYLGLPWLSGALALTLAMAGFAVLSAGMIPLVDHVSMQATRVEPRLQYPRLRLWGSVAFLAMNMAGGVMVAWFGVWSVPYALSALCLVAILAVAAAPLAHPSDPVSAESAGEPELRDGADGLLWLAIIASALINASHAVIYIFGSLYWRSLGIDEATIGALWAVSVAADIVFFWTLGPRAARSVAMALAFLAASAVISCLRFGFMPYATTLVEFVLLQSLHAGSFGAQLVGVMALVGALSPEGKRAAVQGRLAALTAMCIGAVTFASGFIYEAIGKTSFLTMIPVALSGLLVLAVAWRRAKKLGLVGSVPHIATGTARQGG